MHGVRLVVAYDGTDFAGWQVQPKQRTVQLALEKACADMCGSPVRVRGSGRTDAGVHALGLVVAFDSPRDIDPRGWRLGLNTRLPDDVRVQSAEPCEVGYNPRYDALRKHYRYLLHDGPAVNPLLRHRAWHLGDSPALDWPALRDAASRLQGTHDFRAFRSSDDDRPNSTRTLHRLELVSGHAGDPNLHALEVEGDAFMKNMVRILAGTLVEVARGRLQAGDMDTLLGPDAERSRSGQTAPAHGLTLVSVTLGRKSAG